MDTDNGKLTDLVICTEIPEERRFVLAFRDLKLTDDQRMLLDQCLFDVGVYLSARIGFPFVAYSTKREEEE